MKNKFIILIFSFIVALMFCSCSGDRPNDSQGSIDDIANAELTTTGLNDLRSVVGNNWGYAFVAGDKIFNENGYYQFDDVLEYNLNVRGYSIGAESERECVFARGETSVYGIYRATYSNGVGSYYLFIADYENPQVRIRSIGNFSSDQVYVGSGGEETLRLAMIGDSLLAINYQSLTLLNTIEVDGVEDFNYFQQGNCAVAFDEDKTTVYYYTDSGFESVEVSQNLVECENPTVISNTYIFGGEQPVFVGLGRMLTDAEKTQLATDYAVYLQNKGKKDVENEQYSLYINTTLSACVIVDKESGDSVTVSVVDIIEKVPQISAAAEKRELDENDSPYISAVKIVNGELFIIIEKEPKMFVGIRDVNDGVPPMIVKYDYPTNTLTFCGMIDFTGHSVYRIVKL